jgi:hypothetical protein
MVKATPTFFGFVYLLEMVVRQCIALPLPTSKQSTVVGVAFSISEVAY